jgi:DNA-binding response OmpR family regulator
MDSKKTIVIIEDEIEIIEILNHTFNKDGFEVLAYSNAEDFISDRNRPLQCIYLIDWNLPGIQGIDIVKMIRRIDKSSPLFMMSANSRPDHIILGLQAGADDYIVKPFNYNELLIRVRNAQIKINNMQSTMINSGLKILPEANCIIVDGKTLSFTAREFLIFQHLYSMKNIETNRSDIIELFDKEENIQNRNIDVHVFSLRKKFLQNNININIMTVWGKGYKLTTH